MTNPKQRGIKIERVEKVTELLASGLNGGQIYRLVKEKYGWQVSERSIWHYIQRANQIFAEESRTKIVDEYGKALRRLNMLFANSFKIQDYKACLAIQIEINKLLGFTTKSTVEHTGQVTGNTINNIKIEYVHTGKRIATSEDQLDLKRLNEAIEEATIIAENGQNNNSGGNDGPSPDPTGESRSAETTGRISL